MCFRDDTKMKIYFTCCMFIFMISKFKIKLLKTYYITFYCILLKIMLILLLFHLYNGLKNK